MQNIILGIFLLSVFVIVVYGAFFRKIEKVNEQPEENDNNEAHVTEGIFYEWGDDIINNN